MSNILRNWFYVGANAYREYSFSPRSTGMHTDEPRPNQLRL
ncbi:hypothetical protein HDG32_005886 [Paraburkholderia sp. CI2]|nr:hypothetical protein [Paraburkholderia sp. CI2]